MEVVDRNILMKSLIDERAPSTAGIVAGISKGKLWTYPKKSALFAVAYSYCVGGNGLVGSIPKAREQEIKTFLDGIMQEMKQDGEDFFEFSAENPKLYEAIFQMYPDKEIYTEMEYSYRLSECIPAGETPVLSNNKGYQFLNIDAKRLEAFEMNQYDNAEMFLDRYHNSWKCSTDFLKYSKCWVAIWNNRIIGIIFGSSAINDIIVIDVEVEETHRRQGVATELGHLLIEECMKNHLQLQWDHVESNEASRKLAEKLGFKLFKKRPYYWFQI